MAQGRGNVAVFAVAIICLLVLQAQAGPILHRVGDAKGWTFGVAGWTNKKIFRAGDTLYFKYSPIFHNVVAVSKNGYKSCMAPRGSKFYKSGVDKIKLVKGANYFICTFPQHCQSGVKIAVYAL